MKKVYIAGKYDDTSVIRCLNNIKLGIRWAVSAIHMGYIPFCPFLDFMFQLVGNPGLTDKQYKMYSMEWLYPCDEIWMLPNWKRSSGAIAEKDEAVKRGIKVVYLPDEEERPTKGVRDVTSRASMEEEKNVSWFYLI